MKTPKNIPFLVPPGSFKMSGAPSFETEVLTGLEWYWQDAAKPISWSEKQLVDDKTLTKDEHARIKYHVKEVKEEIASIKAQGREPTQGERNRIRRRLNTLDEFGWRWRYNLERTKPGRKGKARPEIDALIVKMFDPALSVKANYWPVHEALGTERRWNKKLKVVEEKPVLSEKPYYKRVKRLREEGRIAAEKSK
jgi:hypothetical protein